MSEKAESVARGLMTEKAPPPDVLICLFEKKASRIIP